MNRIALKLAPAATAVLLALATPVAGAVLTCGAHDRMAELLKKHYAEEVRSLGITGDGALIEVYVWETGTWSIMMTTPRGASCLLAEGSDWSAVPASQKPEA